MPVALSIKDEQTDRLVRQYARLHGTSYTNAIRKAVTQALEREGLEPVTHMARAARIRVAIDDVRGMLADAPVLDTRSPDEILYDEDGIPH